MKTYTITENVITYEPRISNRVNILKPVKTEQISTMQAYTDAAMKYIELYASNISPFSLCHDEKHRVTKCRLYFELSELKAKEIIIERNAR